eukprot:SM000066S20425  [mRNA]  locus=s66:230904:234183:+ [translate_table: standard]
MHDTLSRYASSAHAQELAHHVGTVAGDCGMHPLASSREARPTSLCTTRQIPVWLSKWLPRRLHPKAATQVLIEWTVQAFTATTTAKPPDSTTIVRLRLSSWYPLMAPGGAPPPLDLFPHSATAATTAAAADGEAALASSTAAADLLVESRAAVQVLPGGSLCHPGQAAAPLPPPQYTSLPPLPPWQLQTVGGAAQAAGMPGGLGTMIDELEHGGSEAGPKTNEFDDSSTSPRTQHSKTEQRRRSRIKERFQVLQDLVPRRANSGKRDKASFLLEVIDHVRWLHAKMEWYEQELKQLHAGAATAGPHHDKLLVSNSVKAEGSLQGTWLLLLSPLGQLLQPRPIVCAEGLAATEAGVLSFSMIFDILLLTPPIVNVRRGMPPSTSYGATAISPQAQQRHLLVGDAAADAAAASSTPHLVEPTVRFSQLTEVHVGSSSGGGGGGGGTPVVVQSSAVAQQQQVWWLLMQQQAALHGQQMPARAPPVMPPWQAAEHAKRQREAAEVAEGERHQQSMRLDQGRGGGGGGGVGHGGQWSTPSTPTLHASQTSPAAYDFASAAAPSNVAAARSDDHHRSHWQAAPPGAASSAWSDRSLGLGLASAALMAAPPPAAPLERPHARLFGHSLEPAGVKQSPNSSASNNG